MGAVHLSHISHFHTTFCFDLCLNQHDSRIVKHHNHRCAFIRADICMLFHDGCSDNVYQALTAVQPLDTEAEVRVLGL